MNAVSQPNPYDAIRRIQEAVAGLYGVSMHDLLSDRRTAPLIWPRHLAIHLAAELTLHSTHTIAVAFRREPTTVRYACDSVRAALSTDQAAAVATARLKESVSIQLQRAALEAHRKCLRMRLEKVEADLDDLPAAEPGAALSTTDRAALRIEHPDDGESHG